MFLFGGAGHFGWFRPPFWSRELPSHRKSPGRKSSSAFNSSPNNDHSVKIRENHGYRRPVGLSAA